MSSSPTSVAERHGKLTEGRQKPLRWNRSIPRSPTRAWMRQPESENAHHEQRYFQTLRTPSP